MSNSLPPVPVITFVHAALYTSYALMGGGIGLIILVGYGLSQDHAAVRDAGRHCSRKNMVRYYWEAWVMSNRASLAERGGAAGGCCGCGAPGAEEPLFFFDGGGAKPGAKAGSALAGGMQAPHAGGMAPEAGASPSRAEGLLREAQQPAERYRVPPQEPAGSPHGAEPGAHAGSAHHHARVEPGHVSPAHIGSLLGHHAPPAGDHPHAPSPAAEAANLRLGSTFARPPGLEAFLQSAHRKRRSVFQRLLGSWPLSSVPPAFRTEEEPHVPQNIGLRLLLVDVDYAMRFMHMGIFFLVLAADYIWIRGAAAVNPAPTCDTLMSFIAADS